MTMQSTSIQTRMAGKWVYIVTAAAGLTVFVGVLLWQVRPKSDGALMVPNESVGTMTDGVPPRTGQTELIHDQGQPVQPGDREDWWRPRYERLPAPKR